MCGLLFTQIFSIKSYTPFFETAEGKLFIGSDYGLFISTNSGKIWKQVSTGGEAGNLVQLNGVFMAISMKGVMQSTDDGENWYLVISERGVSIAVKSINNEFTAITYNTAL